MELNDPYITIAPNGDYIVSAASLSALHPLKRMLDTLIKEQERRKYALCNKPDKTTLTALGGELHWRNEIDAGWI